MNDKVAQNAAVDSETDGSGAFPEITVADLPETWLAAMARAGWTEVMPVQAKAMPYVMAGRDLLVQSRTGSGKN